MGLIGSQLGNGNNYIIVGGVRQHKKKARRKPRNMSPTKAALSTLDRASRLFHWLGTHYTAAAKLPPQFLVEVLAKEIGHRGVTVNSILPTAIEGADVHSGVSADLRNFIKSFRPTQRLGTPNDVANAAEYLAGDLAAFVSGPHLLVTGGAPA